MIIGRAGKAALGRRAEQRDEPLWGVVILVVKCGYVAALEGALGDPLGDRRHVQRQAYHHGRFSRLSPCAWSRAPLRVSPMLSPIDFRYNNQCERLAWQWGIGGLVRSFRAIINQPNRVDMKYVTYCLDH